MVELKVDLNAVTIEGKTPASIAICNGHVEVAQILRDGGAHAEGATGMITASSNGALSNGNLANNFLSNQLR